MQKVEIVYRHHVGENKPGDTAKLPQDEAEKLVQSGQAAYPEKAPAGKAAGGATS